MSAVAAPAAPNAAPSAVSVANDGRSKRKVSKPERFQSPPPAKRVKPNPPAASARLPSSRSGGHQKACVTPPPTTHVAESAAPIAQPRAAAYKGTGGGGGVNNGNKARGGSKTATHNNGKKNNVGGAGTHPSSHQQQQLPQQRRRQPPVDSGVSAIALAALSSPSAAALLGQSPVPISAVAAAEASRRQLSLASGTPDTFAGLAMLLEASETSPFRTDFAAVAGAVGNGNAAGGGGAKNRRRAEGSVGAGVLGSPLRPLALSGGGGGGGAVGSPDMAKGWGEGTRRKRTNVAAAARAVGAAAGSAPANAAAVDPSSTKKREGKGRKATAGEKKSGGKAAGGSGGGGNSCGQNAKGATAMGGYASETAATTAAAAAVANASTDAAAAATPSGMSELTPTVHAVATAAPQAVLHHALRWIDLLVADLKGRSAALRRSRRRLMKVKAETEADVGDAGAAAENERDKKGGSVTVEEATLLRDLDRALAAEGRGIDSLLRTTSELRAIAAGELVLPAPAGAGTRDENDGAGAGGSGGKRGRPKGSVAAVTAYEALSGGGDKATACVSECYAPVTALLGAPPPLNDSKLMTDYFRDAAVTSAAAFISTAVKVAAAEGDGDTNAAAAVACPAGLLPTPHIVLGR